MLYTPWLNTLDYVRRHRSLIATETADNDLLAQFILEASVEFMAATGRTFAPCVQTRLQDYQHPYLLTLDEDLLALTTLTNGDANAITSGTLLRPANTLPKWRIELAVNASAIYVFGADPRQALSVTGMWGYVPHYATSAFKASGATLPTGGITSSATSLVFASAAVAALLQVGQYGRMGSEIAQFTAYDSIVTWTLARGELGTTAAAHSAAVSIETFYPLADVMGAVRELVVYKYKAKDRVGGRISVYDGGTVVVDELDPSVQRATDRYNRRTAAVFDAF